MRPGDKLHPYLLAVTLNTLQSLACHIIKQEIREKAINEIINFTPLHHPGGSIKIYTFWSGETARNHFLTIFES